jgi:Fe-S cluster biogenesis protein NfuA
VGSPDPTGSGPAVVSVETPKIIQSEAELIASDAVLRRALLSAGPGRIFPGLGEPRLFGLLPPLPEAAAAADDDSAGSPMLAADGGGIEVVERQGDKIFIKYQGACGTCPSSVGGTLIAIRDVLRDELGPDIEVIEVGGSMFG